MTHATCLASIVGACLALGAGPGLGETKTNLVAECAARAGLEGLAVCKQAAKANPGDAKTRRYLAHSYAMAGHYEDSIEIYHDLVRDPKAGARLHFELGTVLAFIERYREAVTPLETVMRMDPGNQEAYRAAAIVYGLVGRKEDRARVTEMVAKGGDDLAMMDLYDYYADGIGVPKDGVVAIQWLERAAEAGHLGAQARLTEVYLQGLHGTPVNEKRAIYWTERRRREEGR